jgi:hypothetical protein
MSAEVKKICGPGWIPWRRKAPRMTAVEPLPGMPRVRRGMRAPPTEAVAAV